MLLTKTDQACPPERATLFETKDVPNVWRFMDSDTEDETQPFALGEARSLCPYPNMSFPIDPAQRAASGRVGGMKGRRGSPEAGKTPTV